MPRRKLSEAFNSCHLQQQQFGERYDEGLSHPPLLDPIETLGTHSSANIHKAMYGFPYQREDLALKVIIPIRPTASEYL